MVLPFKNQGNWNVAYGIAGLIMAVILFASFQKPKSHSSIPVESLSEKGSIKTLLTDPDFIMYCIVILCYGSAQQICSS
jgi:Na+/melibiose symporter-like transporter